MRGALEQRPYRDTSGDRLTSVAAGNTGERVREDDAVLGELLNAHKLQKGYWLTAFSAREFSLLNFRWLPSAITGAEALRTFVEQGVSRLAPISSRRVSMSDSIGNSTPTWTLQRSVPLSPLAQQLHGRVESKVLPSGVAVGLGPRSDRFPCRVCLAPLCRTASSTSRVGLLECALAFISPPCGASGASRRAGNRRCRSPPRRPGQSCGETRAPQQGNRAAGTCRADRCTDKCPDVPGGQLWRPGALAFRSARKTMTGCASEPRCIGRPWPCATMAWPPRLRWPNT